MATTSRKSPCSTVKVRRLPKVGDELKLTVKVTRTDVRNRAPGDTVTIRIPGYDAPVTINAVYLPNDDV